VLLLLYYVLVWLPTRPLVAMSDDVLVRVGLKRVVSTGRPVWR
jgi:hypothetical protein